MPKKTPPFENYPEWTTARFFGFVRSLLRQGFNRYPPKYRVIKRAAKSVPVLTEQGLQAVYKTGPKAGQVKYTNNYTCASCGGLFKQKEVQVDHITPAGQLRDWVDIEGFVRRLFCGEDGLQVLCTKCHDIKTKEETHEKGIH